MIAALRERGDCITNSTAFRRRIGDPQGDAARRATEKLDRHLVRAHGQAERFAQRRHPVRNAGCPARRVSQNEPVKATRVTTGTRAAAWQSASGGCATGFAIKDPPAIADPQRVRAADARQGIKDGAGNIAALGEGREDLIGPGRLPR